MSGSAGCLWRKPAETLMFANIRPGEQVVELVPGGGYYTRLLSHVVGKHGKIFAVAPAPRTAPEPGEPDRTAAVKAIAADPHYANVTVELMRPKEFFTLATPVDVVWTSQNYHDLHNIKGLDVVQTSGAAADPFAGSGAGSFLVHISLKDSTV